MMNEEREDEDEDEAAEALPSEAARMAKEIRRAARPRSMEVRRLGAAAAHAGDAVRSPSERAPRSQPVWSEAASTGVGASSPAADPPPPPPPREQNPLGWSRSAVLAVAKYVLAKARDVATWDTALEALTNRWTDERHDQMEPGHEGPPPYAPVPKLGGDHDVDLLLCYLGPSARAALENQHLDGRRIEVVRREDDSALADAARAMLNQATSEVTVEGARTRMLAVVATFLYVDGYAAGDVRDAVSNYYPWTQFERAIGMHIHATNMRGGGGTPWPRWEGRDRENAKLQSQMVPGRSVALPPNAPLTLLYDFVTHGYVPTNLVDLLVSGATADERRRLRAELNPAPAVAAVNFCPTIEPGDGADDVLEHARLVTLPDVPTVDALVSAVVSIQQRQLWLKKKRVRPPLFGVANPDVFDKKNRQLWPVGILRYRRLDDPTMDYQRHRQIIDQSTTGEFKEYQRYVRKYQEERGLDNKANWDYDSLDPTLFGLPPGAGSFVGWPSMPRLVPLEYKVEAFRVSIEKLRTALPESPKDINDAWAITVRELLHWVEEVENAAEWMILLLYYHLMELSAEQQVKRLGRYRDARLRALRGQLSDSASAKMTEEQKTACKEAGISWSELEMRRTQATPRFTQGMMSEVEKGYTHYIDINARDNMLRSARSGATEREKPYCILQSMLGEVSRESLYKQLDSQSLGRGSDTSINKRQFHDRTSGLRQAGINVRTAAKVPIDGQGGLKHGSGLPPDVQSGGGSGELVSAVPDGAAVAPRVRRNMARAVEARSIGTALYAFVNRALKLYELFAPKREGVEVSSQPEEGELHSRDAVYPVGQLMQVVDTLRDLKYSGDVTEFVPPLHQFSIPRLPCKLTIMGDDDTPYMQAPRFYPGADGWSIQGVTAGHADNVEQMWANYRVSTSPTYADRLRIDALDKGAWNTFNKPQPHDKLSEKARYLEYGTLVEIEQRLMRKKELARLVTRWSPLESMDHDALRSDEFKKALGSKHRDPKARVLQEIAWFEDEQSWFDEDTDDPAPANGDWSAAEQAELTRTLKRMETLRCNMERERYIEFVRFEFENVTQAEAHRKQFEEEIRAEMGDEEAPAEALMLDDDDEAKAYRARRLHAIFVVRNGYCEHYFGKVGKSKAAAFGALAYAKARLQALADSVIGIEEDLKKESDKRFPQPLATANAKTQQRWLRQEVRIYAREKCAREIHVSMTELKGKSENGVAALAERMRNMKLMPTQRNDRWGEPTRVRVAEGAKEGAMVARGRPRGGKSHSITVRHAGHAAMTAKHKAEKMGGAGYKGRMNDQQRAEHWRVAAAAAAEGDPVGKAWTTGMEDNEMAGRANEALIPKINPRDLLEKEWRLADATRHYLQREARKLTTIMSTFDLTHAGQLEEFPGFSTVDTFGWDRQLPAAVQQCALSILAVLPNSAIAEAVWMSTGDAKSDKKLAQYSEWNTAVERSGAYKLVAAKTLGGQGEAAELQRQLKTRRARALFYGSPSRDAERPVLMELDFYALFTSSYASRNALGTIIELVNTFMPRISSQRQLRDQMAGDAAAREARAKQLTLEGGPVYEADDIAPVRRHVEMVLMSIKLTAVERVQQFYWRSLELWENLQMTAAAYESQLGRMEDELPIMPHWTRVAFYELLVEFEDIEGFYADASDVEHSYMTQLGWESVTRATNGLAGRHFFDHEGYITDEKTWLRLLAEYKQRTADQAEGSSDEQRRVRQKVTGAYNDAVTTSIVKMITFMMTKIPEGLEPVVRVRAVKTYPYYEPFVVRALEDPASLGANAAVAIREAGYSRDEEVLLKNLEARLIYVEYVEANASEFDQQEIDEATAELQHLPGTIDAIETEMLDRHLTRLERWKAGEGLRQRFNQSGSDGPPVDPVVANQAVEYRSYIVQTNLLNFAGVYRTAKGAQITALVLRGQAEDEDGETERELRERNYADPEPKYPDPLPPQFVTKPQPKGYYPNPNIDRGNEEPLKQEFGIRAIWGGVYATDVEAKLGTTAVQRLLDELKRAPDGSERTIEQALFPPAPEEGAGGSSSADEPVRLRAPLPESYEDRQDVEEIEYVQRYVQGDAVLSSDGAVARLLLPSERKVLKDQKDRRTAKAQGETARKSGQGGSSSGRQNTSSYKAPPGLAVDDYPWDGKANDLDHVVPPPVKRAVVAAGLDSDMVWCKDLKHVEQFPYRGIWSGLPANPKKKWVQVNSNGWILSQANALQEGNPFMRYFLPPCLWWAHELKLVVFKTEEAPDKSVRGGLLVTPIGWRCRNERRVLEDNPAALAAYTGLSANFYRWFREQPGSHYLFVLPEGLEQPELAALEHSHAAHVGEAEELSKKARDEAEAEGYEPQVIKARRAPQRSARAEEEDEDEDEAEDEYEEESEGEGDDDSEEGDEEFDMSWENDDGEEGVDGDGDEDMPVSA